MADQLSGITIIYLIAIGLQVFILLFIFAKRQIMRFAWSYRKAPSAPIGHGAPKALKKQTINYINSVGKIYYEPLMMENAKEESLHLYRYKTIDEFRHLYRELSEANLGPMAPLPPSCPISKFVACLRDNGWLSGVRDERVDRMTFLYNKARYTSAPFSREEFIEFSKILASIVADVRRKYQADSAMASVKLGASTKGSSRGKRVLAKREGDSLTRKESASKASKQYFQLLNSGGAEKDSNGKM